MPRAADSVPVESVEKEEAEPVRAKRRLGLGIYLLGPDVLYGGWLNYYILPNLSIEVGGAHYSIPSLSGTIWHAGSRWYFWGRELGKNWSPYFGIFHYRLTDSNQYRIDEAGFYAPFGVEFLGEGGGTFAVETALKLGTGGGFPLWLGLKLGWHF